MKLIAGLDLADDGAIVLNGPVITGRGADWLTRMRRGHIGIVFQFFNLRGDDGARAVPLPA